MTLKVETIISESDIDDIFASVYSKIISKINKSFRIGSGWIIDSAIDHNTNISKHKPLIDNNYIKLEKELNHQEKGLINIRKINDNECFNWCLVRYLHNADHQIARNGKMERFFGDELDFKDIKFPAIVKDFRIFMFLF